jgi:hypothetical protein
MIIQVKQGLGIPTTISEIMRAKAAAAVAEITKNESSLLAGAFVAGSIALGGMNCANPAMPSDNAQKNLNNDAAPSYYEEPAVQEQKFVEQEPAQQADDQPTPLAKYDKLMGQVYIVVFLDSSVALDSMVETIGWCNVYTENGWNQYTTEIAIELPNGTRYGKLTGLKDLEDGGALCAMRDVTGYEGLWLRTPARSKEYWRPGAPTSIREPERKIPNQNGLGL